MKPTEKLLSNLARLDDELRQETMAALRPVAGGRNTDLFTTASTNPWPEVRPSVKGTELYDRAKEIFQAAVELRVSTEGFASGKIISAFQKANDLSNHNRLGPIRLAVELLSDLETA